MIRARARHRRPARFPVPLPDPALATLPDLAGRVVVVTGATGGLGAPIARACAERGATVVLHGRTVAKLEALYDEIVAAGHAEPIILPLDFAKAESSDFGNIASALESQLTRVDGLFHPAGVRKASGGGRA